MLWPSSCQPDGMRRATSSMTPSTAIDGRRVDRHVAGLVVERDVAAGDGDAELEASVAEALDGLGELPHDLGVLGGAEVQAVGDGRRAPRPVTATLRYASARASFAPWRGSSCE